MRNNATSDHFSWFCAILVGLYGLASWLVINGLWVELPLLVNTLPEGWSLPSYLIIIIQIANFSPLLYVPLTKLCKSRRNGFWYGCFQPPERLANYVLLFVGLLCCILLANFWQVVTPLPGLGTASHSVGLFVITLFMALIDCTSTVTFIAYLSGLHQFYIGSLTFGEALSDLVPSTIALIQGANSAPECVNVTINGSIHTVPKYAPPRFSIEVFMYLLAAITAISTIAFCMLDMLPAGLGNAVRDHYLKTYETLKCSNSYSNPMSLTLGIDHTSYDENIHDHDSINQPTTITSLPNSSSLSLPDHQQCEVQIESRHKYIADVVVPLIIIAYISALSFGFLPSLQSYSCASYDILTYHLAVTLSGIVCAILIVIITLLFNRSSSGNKFLLRNSLQDKETVGIKSESGDGNQGHARSKQPCQISTQWIWFILVVVSTIPSGYVIYLARSSPNPPYMGGFGPVLAVIAWISLKSIFTVIRTWIWLHLSTVGVGPMILRFAGLATQIGALLGAICSFLLVVHFNMFQSKPPCPI